MTISKADLGRMGSHEPSLTRVSADVTTIENNILALQSGSSSTLSQIHHVDGASTADVANLAAFTVANDGVTHTAGKRILLKDQTTVEQNGIYVVGTVTTGTAPLTRATDWDSSSEIKANTLVVVAAGTAGANTIWQITGDFPITVGTTHQHFQRAGALTADAIGRAAMATGFFSEAKATDAFAAQAITGAIIKNATVTGTQIAATTVAAANIVNSTITSTQLAANAVAETNLTPSILTGKHVAVGAAGNTVGIIPELFIITVADGSTVLDAVTLDATYGKFEVDDVYAIKNTVTGGATDALQLCTDSGGTTAVSTDLALNAIASGGVVRTATITKANAVFAAGAHLYVKRTHTTDCGGTLYVIGHRVA